MRRLWENSSDKVKKAFPWETIPLKKPSTLKLRIKKSLALGGKASKILQDIQQGKDYKQIKGSGNSGPEINISRKTLRRWGFSGDLPYANLSGEPRNSFIEKLESTQSPEEIRGLFDQFKTTGPRVYGAIERGTLPLTKLGNVLLACGFNLKDNRNKHFFIEELEANGVVVGYGEYKIEIGPQAGRIQRYYFIRSKDVPRAEEILRDNPQLTRFVKR